VPPRESGRDMVQTFFYNEREVAVS
jgi:hypothetical protein